RTVRVFVDGKRGSASQPYSVCPLCRMVIDSKGPCTDRSRCLAAVPVIELSGYPSGSHSRTHRRARRTWRHSRCDTNARTCRARGHLLISLDRCCAKPVSINAIGDGNLAGHLDPAELFGGHHEDDGCGGLRVLQCQRRPVGSIAVMAPTCVCGPAASHADAGDPLTNMSVARPRKSSIARMSGSSTLVPCRDRGGSPRGSTLSQYQCTKPLLRHPLP